MKRSGAPKRRTPLRRDTPKTRAWLAARRKKPIASRGRKAQREAASLAAFREELRRRSGGWCEGRTPACARGRHAGSDCHHLEPADRARGIHDPDRGLFLCRPGHNWIGDHPVLAHARGLLHPDRTV